MNLHRFIDLPLSPGVLKAVEELGFTDLFPIQAQAIMPLLEGKDVIGQAQTGTGKTAAFGIPMIEQLNPKINKVQGLILEPTRELAIQTAERMSRFSKYTMLNVLPVYGGESIQKQLLKAPLHYRRISSYFSNRRFHPILKFYRPHHGIDYAAPRGTPVSTIGDGKVIFVGRKKSYGKTIKIKHNSVYESWYGHLSGYHKRIKKGVYVKKGQVIGYVGSTGLSTGPHLDFRIKKNGRLVNFLKLKFPPLRRLTKGHMEKFAKLRKRYYRYLAELQIKGNFESDDSSS